MTTHLREWMTATEIAAHRFVGLPHSAIGVLCAAEHRGWMKAGPERVRQNERGESEFHLSNIPRPALEAFMEAEAKRHEEAKGKAILDRWEEDRRSLAPVLDALDDRKRRTTEGRIALLAEIDRLIATGFRTRNSAVNELREALLEGRASHELAAFADAASERDGVPSRSMLYQWLMARDQFGLSALVPKDKGRSGLLSDMIPDRLRLQLLLAEEPARRLTERRVRRCAVLLASLTADERAQALDLNAAAVRVYARGKGWHTDV